MGMKDQERITSYARHVLEDFSGNPWVQSALTNQGNPTVTFSVTPVEYNNLMEKLTKGSEVHGYSFTMPVLDNWNDTDDGELYTCVLMVGSPAQIRKFEMNVKK